MGSWISKLIKKENIVFTFLTIVTIILLFVGYNTVVIVPMRSAYVVERFGKFKEVLTPGLHVLIPFFDRVAYQHETREQVFDIPAQVCITQDNIQVEVDGLVYLKVTDPKKASYGIGDYRRASVNLAQTTMRSEVGKLTLSNVFSERESLNEFIVREVDVASDPWGIKVLRYEVKNIRPSTHVVTTLEKQMEAEREKRAEITLALADKESRIILSEGEKIEAINLSEGEKRKKINEALGKAKEIELIAEAYSRGIDEISKSMELPGGDIAVKMQLIDQFVGQVGDILDKSDISVLPNEMANIKGVFEGVNEVSKTIKA